MKTREITKADCEIFAQRFPSCITINHDKGCIEWRGTPSRMGYGVLRVNGRVLYCHRLMYYLFTAEPIQGLVIRHICDNPICINPMHLIHGTQKENIRDSVERGRFAVGNKKPWAKLNPDLVKELRVDRSNGMSYSQLAKKYSIGVSSVSLVVHGKSWKHIQ